MPAALAPSEAAFPLGPGEPAPAAAAPFPGPAAAPTPAPPAAAPPGPPGPAAPAATAWARREGEADVRDELHRHDDGHGEQNQRERHDAGSRRADEAGHD